MATQPASASSSPGTFSGTVRNVVLVHGAYADGSSWSEVIERLQGAGLTATAVQNPLTSLADDVAHTRRVLALQDGPTILAGHSFAGTVITEAGIDPHVVGLVYVAARAPDAGEDYAALANRFPAPPANAGLVYTGGFGALTEDAFLNDFANGIDRAGRGCFMRCKDAFRKPFSVIGRLWRRGGRSRPGMPSPGTIARHRPSLSVSLPTACTPRRLRSIPATCR